MIKGRYKPRTKLGSALILAVVLTSLLAIIGVMFVMMARVDKMATSAISENKELNFAVETVVAKISQELVLDVPGMPKSSEYYDYPGNEDKWLASLEPYKSGTGKYRWRQISDVTGFLNDRTFATQDVNIDPPGARKYIQDYPEITVDASGELEQLWADADGDGIADSKWIELDDITSDKGKPIYAAIRIVDNGGMINVNTAYKFDPNDPLERVNGSSQMQINLAALSQRGANGSLATAANKLQAWRCGTESNDLSLYERDVVWRYNEPNGRYTPFDISDELELRNRFLLEIESIDTAIETFGWVDVFTGNNYLHTPVDGTSCNLDGWFRKAQYDLSEPNATENYSYRHIATTYNTDRIIDPNGAKMTNINGADANSIYRAVKSALDPNFAGANEAAAQIAVNLIDFRDNDSNVTVYTNPDDGKDYYGFESPCIYISELAHRFKKDMVDPNIVYKSYAVELYKPYSEDNDPCNWRLVIDGSYIPIDWSRGSKHFYVVRFEDPNTPPSLSPLLPVFFNDPNDPPDPNYARSTVDPNYGYHFNAGSVISLLRVVYDVNGVGVDIVVDSKVVPGPNDGWWAIDGSAHSIQRDITLHKCIRRLWDSDVKSPTLGRSNAYFVGDSIYIQAHPANTGFTNVGEIGMLFRKGAYGTNGIGYNADNDEEEEVRLDLADPNFQQLFKYLTVFDPTEDNIDNDDDGLLNESDPNKPEETPEFKIPGRININTAPWFVIAQLPWVSQRKNNYDNYDLAQAIASYRDTVKGFKSIGELIGVVGMDYYKTQTSDLTGFPDLTPGGSTGDGAPDDFEERDVIFARISNLVTVRSDVFTAYILVRIGTDGPQKRVMAILDRSNVYSGDGKVRIVALHPVPDPR